MTTWLAFWAHDMMKCTHLVSNRKTGLGVGRSCFLMLSAVNCVGFKGRPPNRSTDYHSLHHDLMILD